jgi:hypothetical protein
VKKLCKGRVDAKEDILARGTEKKRMEDAAYEWGPSLGPSHYADNSYLGLIKLDLITWRPFRCKKRRNVIRPVI